VLGQLARHAEAAQDWGRALELNDEPHRLAEFREQRALSLARAGKDAQAVAAADELAETKGASEDTLCGCARVCALAAAAVEGDPELQAQYAARAVELLRQASARGYKDIARLKDDPDLGALRSRPDFHRLLGQLEAKAKPVVDNPQ
jgi:uncharacterized protein YciW